MQGQRLLGAMKPPPEHCYHCKRNRSANGYLDGITITDRDYSQRFCAPCLGVMLERLSDFVNAPAGTTNTERGNQ